MVYCYGFGEERGLGGVGIGVEGVESVEGEGFGG